MILAAAKFTTDAVSEMNSKILPVIFFLFIAKYFVESIEKREFVRLSGEIQNSIWKKIHDEIFFREISGGELLTLIFDTLNVIEDFFVKVAPHIASIPILLPMFLIVAISIDFPTAGILLATLPIAPFLLYLIGRTVAKKNSLAWGEMQKLNGDFKEILSAAATLKIFERVDAAAEKIKSTSRKSSAATLDVLKTAFVSSFALELTTTLSIALVAVALGLRLISGGAEFEAAFFLLLITPEFFMPIRKFGTAFHVAISAKESFERLRNFLTNTKEITGNVEKLRMPPEIIFKNVSFTYPQKKLPAIHEVSLKIPAGKISVITGESGAGKSTLLKIAAGLYFPAEGEIFFGDLPGSKISRESLSKKIAYMPQAPHLFDTSLAENFLMFDQLDDKELPEFLKALNLNFSDLSAKQRLSRGMLQRMGFIRALLKNSSIMILDEPTAGLDEENERRVLNMIKKFSFRRTILIASHRPAVTKFADFVINLEVESVN